MDEFNIINVLPVALSTILNTNSDAFDYFSNLDRAGQDELIRYSNDFSSREELERYLYYLSDNDFR